jgi:hypothetical protein
MGVNREMCEIRRIATVLSLSSLIILILSSTPSALSVMLKLLPVSKFANAQAPTIPFAPQQQQQQQLPRVMPVVPPIQQQPHQAITVPPIQQIPSSSIPPSSASNNIFTAPNSSPDIQYLGTTDITNLPNVPQIQPTQPQLHIQLHKELTKFNPQTIDNIKAQIEHTRLNIPVITPSAVLSGPLNNNPGFRPFIPGTAGPTQGRSGPFLSSPSQPGATTPNSLQQRSLATTTTTTTTPTAISAGTSFNGLTETESGNYYPPDVPVAAGPNYVTQLVNLEGRVFTKQGGTLSSFSLYPFFKINTKDFISDPRIEYDAMSQRWFAAISDMTTNQIHIAVSTK